jgi:hypothetical protein
MKNDEAIMKAKIEERLRIVELTRKFANLLLSRDGGTPADGYAAALIRGFSDLVEKDEPQPTPVSLSVPPDTSLH